MNKYILILITLMLVGCHTCPNTIHFKSPPELMKKPVPLQKL